MSKTAFVGNLSYATTEEELTTLFAEAGPVVRARIGVDRETGRSRGFAFVEFANDEACAAAIERLNGQEIGGRRLRVNDADDKPPPRAPGGPSPSGFRPNGFAPRPGGPDRFPGRPSFSVEPPPEMFETRSNFDDGRRRPNSKGSRRGLRGRKRSLWS
jgi:RNA recognition motif-containing protein